MKSSPESRAYSNTQVSASDGSIFGELVKARDKGHS